MSKKKKPGKSKSKSKRKAPEAPRTPRLDRVRYVEGPTKPDGNPFVAFRVDGALLKAYKRIAKEHGTTHTALLRDHMSDVTGIPLGEPDESEGDE